MNVISEVIVLFRVIIVSILSHYILSSLSLVSCFLVLVTSTHIINWLLLHYTSHNCIHNHVFTSRHHYMLFLSYTPRLKPSYSPASLYNSSPSPNKFFVVSCSKFASCHTSIPLAGHFPSPRPARPPRVCLNPLPLGPLSSPLPCRTLWMYPLCSLSIIHIP